MYELLPKFEAYLLTEKRVAHNTFLAYKRDLAQFFDYLQKRSITELKRITPPILKDFLYTLTAQAIAPRSRARKIAALKLFFRYCATHHAIANNLAEELVTPRFEQTLPRYCSQEEVAALLAQTQALTENTLEQSRLAAMMYLLYSTGMRVSELVALRCSDLQHDENIITIRGKGGKMRAVPLHPQVANLVRKYMQVSNATSYLFFSSQANRPLSRQTVWGIIKKLARQAAIDKNVSPHTLRHTLATQSIKSGWDIRMVQQLLGHEHIATTQMYTHVEKKHLQEIYQKTHPRNKKP